MVEEQELIDISLRKRDAKFLEKNEEIKEDQPEMNPAKNLEGPNIAFVVP